MAANNASTLLTLISTIIEYSDYVYYDDLIDETARQHPDVTRNAIQVSLCQGIKIGYIVKDKVGTDKFYSIGHKIHPSYLNPKESHYRNGEGTPIDDLMEKVEDHINGLKYAATNERAFVLFVNYYPEMDGYKKCFDRALSRLAQYGQIGRTKSSLLDCNASVDSKLHYGPQELIDQLKRIYDSAKR